MSGFLRTGAAKRHYESPLSSPGATTEPELHQQALPAHTVFSPSFGRAPHNLAMLGRLLRLHQPQSHSQLQLVTASNPRSQHQKPRSINLSSKAMASDSPMKANNPGELPAQAMHAQGMQNVQEKM